MRGDRRPLRGLAGGGVPTPSRRHVDDGARCRGERPKGPRRPPSPRVAETVAGCGRAMGCRQEVGSPVVKLSR
jgi:hypothetical protein